MTEYTPKQFIEMSKVLYCMSLNEFYELYERTPETDPGDYVRDKYTLMRKDLFLYLCELDTIRQQHIFDYAAKKLEWQALKR